MKTIGWSAESKAGLVWIALMLGASLFGSGASAQMFREVPRGPSATAIGPVQGPLQAPAPPPSGQPNNTAAAGTSNAKEPTAAMAADDIVKALLANPDRARGAQAASANPGQPTPPEPWFLDLQIQYEFNSAVILEESHPLLNQVALALNSPRLKSVRFDVEGHTDGVGSKTNNEILSTRRAQSVVVYLTSAGVAADRMHAVGKGFSELLYPFEPKSAANRRVRIRARAL